MTPDARKQFELRWGGASEARCGARWWNEYLSATPAIFKLAPIRLEGQHAFGWDVGADGQGLEFGHAVDVDGGGADLEALRSLADTLAPRQARHARYAVSTLFSVLDHPRGLWAELRRSLRPILSPAMVHAHRTGGAIGRLYRAVGNADRPPSDVAMFLDLPGPESVACAAALAPWFEPVFLFDNWPHPAGLVPSHLTLAAVAQYLPAFVRAAAARAPDAPTMFVADRLRLAPYDDRADRFDNRYMVNAPGPVAMAELGIKRLAYVTDEVARELDDLNLAFVAYDKARIDVRIIECCDFAPEEGRVDPDVYHYGGRSTSESDFWRDYGAPQPSRGDLVSPAERAHTVAVQLGGLPRGSGDPSRGRGARYRPTLRATLFSSFRPSLTVEGRTLIQSEATSTTTTVDRGQPERREFLSTIGCLIALGFGSLLVTPYCATNCGSTGGGGGGGGGGFGGGGRTGWGGGGGGGGGGG